MWAPKPGDIVEYQDPGANVQFRALCLSPCDTKDHYPIEGVYHFDVLLLTRTEDGKVVTHFNQKRIFAIEPLEDYSWKLISRVDP